MKANQYPLAQYKYLINMNNEYKFYKENFSIIAEWLSSMGCDEILDNETRRFYGIRQYNKNLLSNVQDVGKELDTNSNSLNSYKNINELKKYAEEQFLNLENDASKGFIFSEGSIGSDLMIIGDNPETLDINSIKSFQGEIGVLLTAMLKAINFDCKNTYFTNLSFQSYINGRKPVLDDVLKNICVVKRQIELVGPKVIIMFGSIATQSLTGTREGIFSTRGKWYKLVTEGSKRIFPAISMYHPGYLIARPDKKKDAWADLIAVKNKISITI